MPRQELEREVVGHWSHDWATDPYARGAYSYGEVDGLGAAQRFARPRESTLFFAGEATDSTGRSGTVHGALASGQRAAREVLASLS
jgi:monoamine oxidase